MKPIAVLLAVVLLCKTATGRAQLTVKEHTATAATVPAKSDRELKNMIPIGSKVPDISLESISEDTMTLSKIKSNLLLLDFWATRCRSCQEEYRFTLIPLYRKYFRQGFQVFAVSFDRNKRKWRRAIERNKYNWIQVADFNGINRSEIARRYKIKDMPTNYLLDENGVVLAKNLCGKQLESFVEQYLEGK